jgi:hypothetical protein
MKRVLRPVQECLYDFLSRKSWLVRGDFLEEHAKSVVDDLREGEQIISGDYSNATDAIPPVVTRTVVEVLLTSPYLSPEERNALSAAFPACGHKVRHNDEVIDIVRGQPMGSRVSFPILCLINRICWEICDSMRNNRGGRSERRAIFNGDDCAFSGDDEFYRNWRTVTSHFGLVVNEQKTGRSRDHLELNSRRFIVSRQRFLRKPVLSFILPGNEPGCLLSRVWEGVKCLSAATLRLAVLGSRAEIQRRGCDPGALPERFTRVLLKERWFRRIVIHPPRERTRGITRCWKVVSTDFRPAPGSMRVYEEAKREALRIGVQMCQGKKCLQPEITFVPSPVDRSRRAYGRIQFRSYWSWRWTLPVLRWWERCKLPICPLSPSRLEDDHPDLAVRIRVLHITAIPTPSCLLTDFVPDEAGYLHSWG